MMRTMLGISLIVLMIGCASQTVPSEKYLAENPFAGTAETGTWQAGPAASWSPEELQISLGNAAKLFKEYGLVRAHFREYVNGETTFKVNLYEMESSEAAYGIFSISGVFDQRSAEVGENSILTDLQLIFRQGRFFADIQRIGPFDGAKEQLVGLGRGILKGLGGPSGTPDIMKFLPRDSLVNDTERLLSGKIGLQTTFLGQELSDKLVLKAIDGILYGKYEMLNDRYEMLVFVCVDESVASETTRKFNGYIVSDLQLSSTNDFAKAVEGWTEVQPVFFGVKNAVIALKGRLGINELLRVLSWTRGASAGRED